VSYLVNVFRATEDENRRVILGMLDRQPDARLLDLGCYDGEWTSQLAERIGTKQVSGVEVMSPMAAKTRARGVDVVEASLNDPGR
jgi:trans-aconitate methyltransferase